MKLRELLNGLTILACSADLDGDIREVRYDSRAVEEGDLFVAITGAETDGHKYIPMAREKGAACVVCQTVPEDGTPYVQVADSRRALAVIGAAFIALGFWMKTLTVEVPHLFPIGLRAEGVFVGSDYFPIFPGLGWFLVGAALGKSIYRRRESLLPRVNADFFLLRFFRWVGKYSLFFYLLHQPVLFILVNLFA